MGGISSQLFPTLSDATLKFHFNIGEVMAILSNFTIEQLMEFLEGARESE